MISKQEESTSPDRWGIFIYICQPFLFLLSSLLMLMMWFNRQHTVCVPSIKHTHEFVAGGKKIKNNPLLACLVQNWIGNINKYQTTATWDKLYFIIKWLLIRVSSSYRRFDQCTIVTKAQLLPLSLSCCSSADLMQQQRACLLTATAVNYFKIHVTLLHLTVLHDILWWWIGGFLVMYNLSLVFTKHHYTKRTGNFSINASSSAVRKWMHTAFC